MKKYNWVPLVISILLVGLIAVLTLLRLRRGGIWDNNAINFDMVIPTFYVLWMLIESNVSVKELSQGERTSDYGTCELYATGQAGVILSALWFDTLWAGPSGSHLIGVALLVSGALFRLWAIRTLGRYYSHIVRTVGDHRIITTGPYRYIRHPSYAGMITANAGIALFFLNWVTCVVFFCVLIPAIVLRILVEEKTLYRIRGYHEYAGSRKRLLPAIW